MSRCTALPLSLLALILSTGGCGGAKTPEEPVLKTPPELVSTLDRYAAMGNIDGILVLLTDDARRQSGKDWTAFVRRAGGRQVNTSLASLARVGRATLATARQDLRDTERRIEHVQDPRRKDELDTRRRKLQTAISGLESKLQDVPRIAALPTDQFMDVFHHLAPEGFAKMFSFYLTGEYEEDGRVLVYMTNDRGYLLYLGMERQDSGGLKLMGEVESKKVFDALQAKLKEKLQQDTP